MAKIQKKSKQQFHFFIFHPKIVHQGATKLSSHRSHRTHRSFWRKVFSHRFRRYAQIRRVWHPCHTHAATKLSPHRTLRSLTICVHLCASVGGSSPPEASVYSVNSVGEYPPPETSVNSVNSVGGLAQTNLEWVLWKEFGGQRGYGRNAIPTYENSHRLHGCAQIRRVWHPAIPAATKLSSHRIRGTHRNNWRRRKICVHL